MAHHEGGVRRHQRDQRCPGQRPRWSAGARGAGQAGPIRHRRSDGVFRRDRQTALAKVLVIDCPPTLRALSDAMRGSAGQLTVGQVCGDDRGLTTQLAQLVRNSVLDDGSLPLGIAFPSKTAYGRCWAWWNRRADDNLNPGRNGPKLANSLNVAVPELHALCQEWQLDLVGATPTPR